MIHVVFPSWCPFALVPCINAFFPSLVLSLPWLLRPSEIRAQMDKDLGSNGGSYARLHAMGVDAYRLMERIRQLQAFPDSRIYGASGILSLDDQRRIHRSTECTEFAGGVPVRLAEQPAAPLNSAEAP